MISSFQDCDYIYIITTFFEGKSLNFLRNDILTDEQIKFASACIIQLLNYLREKQIIHRDIMMKILLCTKINISILFLPQR